MLSELIPPIASLFLSGYASFLIDLFDRSIRFYPKLHKIAKFASQRTEAVIPLCHIAAWDRLTERVTRINGLNPGSHTLQGTNTYLVGSGKRRWLIDTGEGKTEYLSLLQQVMKEVDCTELEGILLTHHHADHVGGVPSILKAFGPLPIFKLKPQPDSVDICSFKYENIINGQSFCTEDSTLRAIFTPGHTSDHVSFSLVEENALFGGDMILGCGTAIFDDFPSYMSSLQMISEYCDGNSCKSNTIQSIYPGHGPVINDPKERIQLYINHRIQREQQIFDYFQKSGEKMPKSSLQVTMAVYGWLPLPILVAAHHNTILHVEKLVRDNRLSHFKGFIPSCYKLKES